MNNKLNNLNYTDYTKKIITKFISLKNNNIKDIRNFNMKNIINYKEIIIKNLIESKKYNLSVTLKILETLNTTYKELIDIFTSVDINNVLINNHNWDPQLKIEDKFDIIKKYNIHNFIEDFLNIVKKSKNFNKYQDVFKLFVNRVADRRLKIMYLDICNGVLSHHFWCYNLLNNDNINNEEINNDCENGELYETIIHKLRDLNDYKQNTENTPNIPNQEINLENTLNHEINLENTPNHEINLENTTNHEINLENTPLVDNFNNFIDYIEIEKSKMFDHFFKIINKKNKNSKSNVLIKNSLNLDVCMEYSTIDLKINDNNHVSVNFKEFFGLLLKDKKFESYWNEKGIRYDEVDFNTFFK